MVKSKLPPRSGSSLEAVDRKPLVSERKSLTTKLRAQKKLGFSKHIKMTESFFEENGVNGTFLDPNSIFLSFARG